MLPELKTLNRFCPSLLPTLCAGAFMSGVRHLPLNNAFHNGKKLI